MKLKKSQNINEILENVYNVRKEVYAPLFELSFDHETQSGTDINYDTFFSIFKNTDFYKENANNPNISSTGYALFCVYNWTKYRLIYNVNNADKSISKFDTTINKDILDNLFFNHFYISFDLNDISFIGAYVSKVNNKLFISFLYKNGSDYYTDSLFINVIDGETLENVACLNDDPVLNSLFLSKQTNTITCAKQILQIIYALHQGYTHQKEIKVIHDSDRQYMSNHNIKIQKSQIIKIEVEYKPTQYVYFENKIHSNGSSKSPHPRRGHIRRLKRKDENGNIYEKPIWINSTVIHKDQYQNATKKDVK